MLKCDMHVHSVYSDDSSITVRDITRLWEKRGIISIVCDHDTIDGSVEVSTELLLRDRDIPMIIAEEVLTSEGDIIGLFLTEEIPPSLTAAETIDLISAQGALSIIPHPFSTLRSSTIIPDVLDSIIGKIDIIEGYNGRMMKAGENQMASEYAIRHRKPLSLGSDAHTSPELGGCFMNMDPFDTPSEFLASLSRSSYGPVRSINTVFSSSYSLR
jgi:predicted metal-dependent phosphoesterase TrpH